MMTSETQGRLPGCLHLTLSGSVAEKFIFSMQDDGIELNHMKETDIDGYEVEPSLLSELQTHHRHPTV